MDPTILPPDLQEVVKHHTHLCPGVLLGYRACKYAFDLIGKSDRMLVVASNENCGNDAVKVLLNCSKEAGTLIILAAQRQSLSFYNYEEDEGVSLILNPVIGKQFSSDRNQDIQEIMNLPDNVLFIVEPFEPGMEK
ncbi:MAG TPA: hypothetical protein DEF34_04495 [Desulfotomaculum sp.]|nr:hypothetical protein [Desulfotomaculum sp.]